MENKPTEQKTLSITYVPIDSLRHAEYNPRISDEGTRAPVRESIQRHGIQDPLLVNNAPGREGIIIAGNLRYDVLKELGYTEVPIVFATVADLEREKDLCLRLNKAVGDWDWNLLAEFDETFLADIGFSSEELDEMFALQDMPLLSEPTESSFPRQR